MGDPRRQRPRYSKPAHPWKKERIDEENALIKEYGFKNKRELWRVRTILTNFYNQTKQIIAARTDQAEKEKIQLLRKLSRLGLIDENADVETILNLTLKDLLERRLQSIVFRKGLARSMKQARQFITHNHITVGGKKVTAPGLFVSKDLEPTVSFVANSSFNDEMHPERIPVQKKAPKEPKTKEKPGRRQVRLGRKQTQKPIKPEVKKEKTEEKKEAPKPENKKPEGK